MWGRSVACRRNGGCGGFLGQMGEDRKWEMGGDGGLGGRQKEGLRDRHGGVGEVVGGCHGEAGGSL